MKNKIQILILTVMTLLFGCTTPTEQSNAKTKVMIVTGGHGFEKEPFYKMFEDNSEITFASVTHSKTNASAYDRDDLLSFDVVVLYDIGQKISEAQKAKFLSLIEKGKGLVVLHHAIVSYQDWPDYERIIGGRYPEDQRTPGKVTAEVGWKHDEIIPVTVVAKNHPITKGVNDFTIHDEIYWGYRVNKNVTPLLITTHPKSAKILSWCRTEKKSRIVYLQLGHDHHAYNDENYRRLLAQSIRWAAKKDRNLK